MGRRSTSDTRGKGDEKGSRRRTEEAPGGGVETKQREELLRIREQIKLRRRYQEEQKQYRRWRYNVGRKNWSSKRNWRRNNRRG